jgi:hypothetical protein
LAPLIQPAAKVFGVKTGNGFERISASSRIRRTLSQLRSRDELTLNAALGAPAMWTSLGDTSHTAFGNLAQTVTDWGLP